MSDIHGLTYIQSACQMLPSIPELVIVYKTSGKFVMSDLSTFYPSGKGPAYSEAIR